MSIQISSPEAALLMSLLGPYAKACNEQLVSAKEALLATYVANSEFDAASTTGELTVNVRDAQKKELVDAIHNARKLVDDAAAARALVSGLIVKFDTGALAPATPPGATTGVASVVIDAGAGQDAEPATPPVADPPAVSQTVLNSERMVECMKRFDKILRETRNTLTFGGKDMPNCCNLVAEKMSNCVYCCSAWEQGSWVPTPPKFPVSFQACEHCKSFCELVGEFIGTVASILGASAAGSVAGQ